jgi:glutaredoxin
MSTATMKTVTLYGAPECCLCAAAKHSLEKVRLQRSFNLVEIDISEDDDLYQRYLERIPVVFVEDELQFEYEVDEIKLLAMLAGGNERV